MHEFLWHSNINKLSSETAPLILSKQQYSFHQHRYQHINTNKHRFLQGDVYETYVLFRRRFVCYENLAYDVMEFSKHIRFISERGKNELIMKHICHERMFFTMYIMNSDSDSDDYDNSNNIIGGSDSDSE